MIFGIYIRRMMFALKILIYALGLICQVMRCVGHDLRTLSLIHIYEPTRLLSISIAGLCMLKK